MPKGRFNSLAARERHKLASSRGGRTKAKKGFAVTGDAADAGRRSGEARRRSAGKEISILDPQRTQKAG